MTLTPDSAHLLFTRMHWEERWLEFEPEGCADLPAYAGSTLRGALGTVMRPALCAEREQGGCGEQCGRPAECRFHSLFEQSRAEGGEGPNIPKPLILEAPLGEGLRAIACGAPVAGSLYTLRPGAPMPVLEARERVMVEGGSRIRVGLRALGAAAAALDGIVEGVRRCGLEVKGGRLRLTAVESRRGSLGAELAEGSAAAVTSVVRLALVTPTLIGQSGGRGVCFDPAALATLVPAQALVRTVALYNAFYRGPREEKIPFVTAQWPGVQLTAHRLFRYRLPRQSYRQGRWMNFDGVVGWMEWEGRGVAALVPWLRAAEALHVGQKATFGLGRVELFRPGGGELSDAPSQCLDGATGRGQFSALEPVD
jgi:hypothetical protein